jgi:Spermine/spermidine synthase domain
MNSPDTIGDHIQPVDRTGDARPIISSPLALRPRRARIELVLSSALMLFVELVLIRWTGAMVVYLSYFSNFVLLGSFLGIGIGFLRARKAPRLFPWAAPLVAFFAAFVTALPVEIDRSGSDLVFFGALQEHGLPAWVMLPLIFIAVAAIMATLAHGVAIRFAQFEALEAYRLEITGSLLGILSFAAVAFLGTSPLAWGGLIAAALLLLESRRSLVQLASVALIVAIFAMGSFYPRSIWSPYYLIRWHSYQVQGHEAIDISVNRIPHQAVMSNEGRRRLAPYYFTAFERIDRASLGDVLIVGAGSGSDVAIALERGASHVDAVEIDRELYKFGVQRHPEHPYADPRVEVFVTDGRAFLQSNTRNYDVILFALPDSLTLVSGQSALRLESYLFTREAFETVRARLNPGGVFAMYNFYRERWLVDRLAGTLQTVFGAAPCLDTYGVEEISAFSVMVVGQNGQGTRCAQTWSPAGPVVEPATDDHPFLYLRTRTIPHRYVVTLLLIIIASLVAVRWAGGPFGRMAGYVDLAFMGGAFLLLETMNVVRFALLFGTTWFVNALVFAGILFTVLLAVEFERRVRVGRPGLLFSLLFISIGVSLLVPSRALLSLSFVSRFAAATGLAFAPIFIANVVFARRFRDTTDPTAAFGANLLGAMLGGTLEYLSLVTGHRILLVVAATLYGLAWLSWHRIREGAGATARVA